MGGSDKQVSPTGPQVAGRILVFLGWAVIEQPATLDAGMGRELAGRTRCFHSGQCFQGSCAVKPGFWGGVQVVNNFLINYAESC